MKTEYYDYDESEEMVNKYNIGDIIPVAIFLDKNDNEITRLVGEIDKKKIIKIIEANKDK